MSRQQKTVYLDDEDIDYLEGSAEEKDTSFNEEIREALGFAIQWYKANGGDTATTISEIYAIQQEMKRHSRLMENLDQRMTDLVDQLPEDRQAKIRREELAAKWLSEK